MQRLSLQIIDDDLFLFLFNSELDEKKKKQGVDKHENKK
jgi:hypothetical protein